MDKYGVCRVLEPRNVLPTLAWKIDNSRQIKENELRVAIKRIHIETTGFKQIAVECNNNPPAIKKRIIDIVNKRGKLHNPITNTGGIVFGVVEEIGPEYKNEGNISIGDEVICNASLAGIPLFINKISNIEFAYSQIEADGYAIVSEQYQIVKKPEDVPINLLLFSFDESGTLLDVANSTKNKKKFLVVGNNMFTNLLFGYAIRMKAGKTAKIVCMTDQMADNILKGTYAKTLMKDVFTEIHSVDILRPLASIEQLNMEDVFDMTINCADVPGAETVSVIATKPNGTVYFTNLVNNHYFALYITESVKKPLEIKCAQGFVVGYDTFNIAMFRQMGKAISEITLDGAQSEGKLSNEWYAGEMTIDAKLYDRRHILEDFISESRVMQTMLDKVLAVAKYDCNVLITGETGVGKEKVAALIHKNSGRNMKPFVKINCAAISENLIESELFGYEKGSFTGASQSGKKGYFEIADNGIIFLDEVGELPLDLQAKLLRVIQEGEFYRVGGVMPIRTNVRIISATNRNLKNAVGENAFRNDLYYRLNVYTIKVPGLNERRSEIPALVQHFTEKYNEKFGMTRVIMRDGIEYLKDCRWPGNIRELENVVQRLLISAKGEFITIFDVIREMNTDIFPTGQEVFPESSDEIIYMEKMVRNFEREIIRYAMEKHGSTRKAAKALGISQSQIVRKKNMYDV